MVPADKSTAPASPLHLDWEPNGSWLRCVVGWPDARPPLSRGRASVRASRTRPRRPSARGHGGHLRVLARREPAPGRGCCRCSPRRSPPPGSARWTGTSSPPWSSRRTCARGRCSWSVPDVSTCARLGSGPAGPTSAEILTAHREFVRHWVEVFEERFDPEARRGGREQAGDVRRRRNDQGRVPRAGLVCGPAGRGHPHQLLQARRCRPCRSRSC